MNLKFFILVLLLLIPISSYTVCQQNQNKDYDLLLSLNDNGQLIEDSIKLYITGREYNSIKVNSGIKIDVKPRTIIINEDSVSAEKVKTRGQTTLFYRRKSLSFNLLSPAEFIHREQKESLTKFCALSLSMDRNYCNNRLAYELMGICDIFNLFYSYCELSINDNCEGLYLIVERPEEWAFNKKESPLVIRRGYDHKIEKLKTDKKIDKSEIRKYCGYYNEIYKCLNKYEGKELYDTITKHLDLDIYMDWLAFNFFIRNGDYTDEVWFYFDPSVNKFRIIPWDYDDIFFSAPHEGTVAKSELAENILIFSAEDPLDEKIASDSYLYNLYLNRFTGLLNKLTPSVLKRTFENTYAELYPYYADKEITDMSDYDAFKNVNFDRLENDLSSMFSQLWLSREIYLKNISEIQSVSEKYN